MKTWQIPSPVMRPLSIFTRRESATNQQSEQAPSPTNQQHSSTTDSAAYAEPAHASTTDSAAATAKKQGRRVSIPSMPESLKSKMPHMPSVPSMPESLKQRFTLSGFSLNGGRSGSTSATPTSAVPAQTDAQQQTAVVEVSVEEAAPSSSVPQKLPPAFVSEEEQVELSEELEAMIMSKKLGEDMFVTRVDVCLDNKLCADALKEFMSPEGYMDEEGVPQGFVDENIHFLLAIRKLQNRDDILPAEWKSLFETYINDNASLPINIPNDLKNSVVAAYNTYENTFGSSDESLKLVLNKQCYE
jgi:hypothetical protein